jgi:hypothetical protein
MIIIENNLNKEDLLKLVSQESIMKYYLGYEINTKDKFINPLRSGDTRKGCFFLYSSSGVLYFMDYANTKTHLNCFDVASMATGVEFPKIINRIHSDLEKQLKFVYNREIITAQKKECDIKVTLIPFADQDIQYWSQYVKSESETLRLLKFFNIRKCERVWINNEIWKVTKESEPIYRYRQKDKIKIYRPFSKKEDKFRNNYYGGLLDGWEQLPSCGTVCFIQKAMKESFSMYSYGFSSVGVRGEGIMISENALNLLKMRFKYVIPYMDNDKLGKEMLLKYKKEYGLEGICNPENKPKDFGDWVKMDKEEPEKWLTDYLKTYYHLE